MTKNLIHEFLILHKSLQLFNPETKIVVLCDDESAKIILALANPNIIVLNELKKLNYSAIKLRKKHFLKLVLRKCDVMQYAVDTFGETLFVDTDIVFLNPFKVVSDKQLVLSRHHIDNFFEEKYGKYNVGYLLIRDKSFPEWLKKATLTRSNYFEQECLNHAEREFDIEVFSMNHNFGWWRLYQYKFPGERYQKFDYGSTIFWNDEPLVSVHVHMCSDGFKK